MNLLKNSSDTCNKYNNLMIIVPTEEETLQKIRTVPNILKRKRSEEMNNSRIVPRSSMIEKNIKRKKQIFDPVRSELLIWDDLHMSDPIMSKINIGDMNISDNSLTKVESDLLEYSPMWCPSNAENYWNKQAIQIVETVTINLPISEITDLICSKFMKFMGLYEFHHEMNIPIFDDTNSDVETIIELGRFELNINNDEIESLEQKDPFNEISIRSSWNKFECLSCGKVHRSQSSLNYHLKAHHNRLVKYSSNPVIVLTCPGCFKIFKSSKGYDRHMIYCNIRNQFREE